MRKYHFRQPHVQVLNVGPFLAHICRDEFRKFYAKLFHLKQLISGKLCTNTSSQQIEQEIKSFMKPGR